MGVGVGGIVTRVVHAADALEVVRPGLGMSSLSSVSFSVQIGRMVRLGGGDGGAVGEADSTRLPTQTSSRNDEDT